MATTKYKGLKLGPGAINNKTDESEFFVSNRLPYNGTPGIAQYSSVATYGLGDAVLYQGVSYNSLQAGNTSNQPDTSPLWWSEVDGKDGDIWIKTPSAGFPTGGSDVEMYIKASNVWQGTKGTPFVVSLVDGQLTPATALEYPSSAFRYAQIDYTVKRGTGDGRKRSGTLTVLHDGSSPTPVYSHEFNEIGIDINCPFTVSYSGGNVKILYTSVNEGVALELKYVIKGWN